MASTLLGFMIFLLAFFSDLGVGSFPLLACTAKAVMVFLSMLSLDLGVLVSFALFASDVMVFFSAFSSNLEILTWDFSLIKVSSSEFEMDLISFLLFLLFIVGLIKM